ncbi:LOG family protein [Bartonella tamiae]|uniref:AMP nucleosidase n=1 Tax=Bartonella tamiae Th239 TaxID=1094558 RepID=J0ZQS5_9HYPH|nr:LOG family protein [Bartonella tamiae]EJF91013.1 TIGR00730 family protein [Bartonella tamiae Th239]EJF93322.1 TIGR00730 family protein [Bartonella tamiae Th307]
MAKDEKNGWTPFSTSKEDVRIVDEVPDTPQTRSPTYRLAYDDPDFLMRPEMRAMRIGLELTKPELGLKDFGIKSTIVLFGGARIPAPGQAAWAAKNDTQRKNLEKSSHYYEEARKFAQLCSCQSAKHDHREFVIVTGGGPGVMEAGNRGAADANAPSIGLNIVLPHEQAPNIYVTPELCFNFHYFGMRKMHFLMRAKALAIFPGGFGTLDELFEALTLIQTGRMHRVPIVMFGGEFWKNVINVDYLAEQGTISPTDKDLLHYVDNAQEGWNVICQFYGIC